MSGISTTLLLINGKLKEDNIVQEMDHLGDFTSQSKGFYEMRLNKTIEIKDKTYFIDNNILIEYSESLFNPGFNEAIWKKIVESNDNLRGVVDITCMSRNKETIFLLLQILDAFTNYGDFLIINGYPGGLVVNKFKSKIVEISEGSMYILNSAVIKFMYQNDILDIGYN